MVWRWWERVQASRWWDRGLWLLAAGMLPASLGWLYVSFGGDAQAAATADQDQSFAMVLGMLGVVAAVTIAVRAAGGRDTPVTPRVALARRVYQEECRVRAALLRGIAAADVERIGAHDGPPSRDGAVAGSSGAAPTSGGRPAGGSPPHVRRTAARLLTWQEEDAGGTGRQTEGSLADIGGYYLGLPDRRLVIVGDKGSGKTVLANELVITLAKAVVDDPAAATPSRYGSAPPPGPTTATWPHGWQSS